jgi:hypothetical protein
VANVGSGSPVSILTSGIGLGVYIPALLIQRQMRALGVTVDVETLERYYSPNSQRRHLAHKKAYHHNFRLALIAHRMARSVESCLEQPRIDELLRRWIAEGRKDFIVWSGFWLPILERYRQLTDSSLQIDCCRIDAAVSASFRAHDGLARDAAEIWLWNWQERKTIFEISVNDQPPIGFSDRDRRLVLHGGGWGIGTYREARAEMRNTKRGNTTWALDVVVHDRAEAVPSRSGDRYFMVDPDWRTWHRGHDGHTFPPFADVDSAREAEAGNDHALYELIRRSKAIISKPGGGTLIDSLSSATPVVLLEPFGHAEACNGALWEHLGFGIPFSKWCETGCSESALEELHENLLRRERNGPDYPRHYVERIRQRERACDSPSL